MSSGSTVWAFGELYRKRVSTALGRDIRYDDFLPVAQWIDEQAQKSPPASDREPRAVRGILAYVHNKEKQSEVGSSNKSHQEAEAAQAGLTLSAAEKNWSATKACVGLVTSSQSSAYDHNALKRNDWHMVAVARDGKDVWVHDTQYDYTEFEDKKRPRVRDVRGVKMVHELVKKWTGVRQVFFQGPPPEYQGGDQLECMGRSVLWVQETLNGNLPWPPNGPGGGVWHSHYKN